MRSFLLTLSLLLLPGLALAQGFERAYEIKLRECDVPSRQIIEEGLIGLPGYQQLRPNACSNTRCDYEYTSVIPPNDLMLALRGIVDATGYRSQIGVLGTSYQVVCLPGRRAHPLAPRQPYQVYRSDCGVLFDAAGEVLFDYNKASIRPEAIPVLEKVIEETNKVRPLELSITGHTDSRGSRAYNQGLSEARSLSVAQWLVNTGRIPGIRVVAYGRGEDQPVAPNAYPNGADYPEGRQLNRRVEIFLQTKAECRQ